MKKQYILAFIVLIATIIIFSCSKSESENYIPIEAKIPVNMNLSKVPFNSLSEYHFFEGNLKDLKPSTNVIPYEPASSLFADYAHKKRFVWMPAGTKATYVSDDNVFEFPVGAVLIKTFYYENVQPNNTTQIIETRLLIRKSDGWKAYDYVWNTNQTEAVLDTTGAGFYIPVTFKENNITKTVNYKTPAQTECTTCHKINPNQTGEITIPIGPKPQNLNTLYNYNGILINQIEKWKSQGYLGNDVPALSLIKSTVDWRDTNKSLELRARSYIDINCAHCHRDGGHCEYVPQRFNFSNTNNYTFGICLPPRTAILGSPFEINAGNAANSLMIVKMSSTQGSVMMPPLSRTLVHEEGVQLISDWINAMPSICR